MAQTLVKRELFAGTSTAVGSLTSGSPGSNFASVTGTLYQRPVGPRVGAAAPGWSAQIRSLDTTDNYGIITLADGTRKAHAFGCFYIRKQAGNPASLIAFRPGGDPTFDYVNVVIKNDGHLHMVTVFSGDVDLGACPIDQWFFLSIVASTNGSNQITADVYFSTTFGALGSSKGTLTNSGFSNGDIKNICFGSKEVSGNGAGGWVGRMGAATVYTLGVVGDAAYPSDVIAPPTAVNTWYCNPSTGSDNNDGLTALTAWQTDQKISDELAYSGIFPGAASIGGGDTCYVDTSAAILDMGYGIRCPDYGVLGFSLLPLNTAAISFSAFKTITDPWTLSANCTKTYQVADSLSLAKSVVFEDRKWMNHPWGASFATVKTAMEATAGSMFNDGTNLYLHPFGDTNPNSDGKTYERSRYFAGVNNEAAISYGPWWHVGKVNGGGTTTLAKQLVDSGGTPTSATAPDASNFPSPGLGYVMSDASACDKTNYATAFDVQLDGGELSHSGIHPYGQTRDWAAGSRLLCSNLTCSQASAWGVGTAFVIFSGANDAKTAIITGLNVPKSYGKIGSTAGQSADPIALSTGGAFYTHSGGGSSGWTINITNSNFDTDVEGTNFVALNFAQCNIGAGLAAGLGGINCDGGSATITADGCNVNGTIGTTSGVLTIANMTHRATGIGYEPVGGPSYWHYQQLKRG